MWAFDKLAAGFRKNQAPLLTVHCIACMHVPSPLLAFLCFLTLDETVRCCETAPRTSNSLPCSPAVLATTVSRQVCSLIPPSTAAWCFVSLTSSDDTMVGTDKVPMCIEANVQGHYMQGACYPVCGVTTLLSVAL